MDDNISIRGARVHNLKNVSLDIPHNQLTVITGVSGSGKSSLAFDTIYAEGQRRYVESLSSYARQFLERMEKPDVDEIDGIAPAIAIRQRTSTRSPRSTVATSTESYDFLRLLFARIGRTYCFNCGRQVARDTVERTADAMLAQPAGSRWYIFFPVPRIADEGQRNAALFELRRKGFNRLFQNGKVSEFSTPESLLELDFGQPVFILADRVVIAPDLRQRLADTVEICYQQSGEATFENAQTGDRLNFSESFACKFCNLEYNEPEPILFSFNSPAGACPRCQGFGNTIDFSMDLAVPDTSLCLDEGAVEPWTKSKGKGWLEAFRKKPKVRSFVPVCEFTPEERARLDAEVREFFAYLDTKKYKLHVRVFLSRYRGYAQCPDCHGARLRKEALYVRVDGKTIADVLRLNIEQAYAFVQHLALTPEEISIAERVLVELRQRLKFLNDVGLEYITLDRMSSTLSGGESQRIQLATCLGSRLVGSCYVLDEPSIGLHTRDTMRLVKILHELRELGNTIIVVEHDPDVMRAADFIVDLGPGAGELGGHVIFAGPYKTLATDRNGSLTAKYLRGLLTVTPSREPRPIDRNKVVRFTGVRLHNLKGVDVEIPLNRMVVITGVSGSGKSTLVHDVIYRALARQAQDAPPAFEVDDAPEPVQQLHCKSVENAGLVREVVMIDQSPIGRTPRSNPVTYIKAFDIIRGLFSATKEAEKRGYTAGHFSFNVAGGRCEVCQGDGTVSVEMQFLADVELTCEECKGKRYKSGILEIRYKTRNIHEVLNLTVQEAVEFFIDTPRLANKLKVLVDVGLGYLRMGQSATTLSGGEAQRVKLAARLAEASSSGALFIFDEPTTGLHFDDIAKLLNAFERLVKNGGSLLIIEHNLDVIRAADWIIDMGPEGGDGGGEIVAQGTPQQIVASPRSHTGRYL